MRRALLLPFVMLVCASAYRGAGAVPPTTVSSARQAFDPRALLLLQKMCDAYAHTTTIDQRTVYYSALIPLQPQKGVRISEPEQPADSDAPSPQDQKMDRSLRLIVMPPNRMRLELQEPDPRDDSKKRISIWDCDGKTFWTYAPDTQYYTKERAPGQLTDFAKMKHMATGSLEMMMMLGLSPFANIHEAADGARLGQTETVRGALTDVVILTSIALSSVTEVRLYIDRDSALLHRLTVETTPMKYNPSPEPGRVGDDLDALANGRHAPIPRPASDLTLPRNITRVTYDNLFGPAESVNVTDFTFKIPPNALLYAPFEMGKPIGPSLHEMLRGLKIARVRKYRIIRP